MMTFLQLAVFVIRSFKTKRFPHHYYPLFPTVVYQCRVFRLKVKQNNPEIPLLEIFNGLGTCDRIRVTRKAYFLRISRGRKGGIRGGSMGEFNATPLSARAGGS